MWFIGKVLESLGSEVIDMGFGAWTYMSQVQAS